MTVMKAYIIIVKKAAKKQYAKFLDYLYQTFGVEDKCFLLGEMSWAVLSNKSANELHKEMTAYLPKGSRLYVLGWLGTELSQWTDDPEADTVLNDMFKQCNRKYIPLLTEIPK